MNLKDIIFKMLTCMLLLFSLASCRKFLEEKSNFGLQSPTTLESLQGILDNSTDMNMNIPSFGDIHADDYFLMEKEFNAVGDKARGYYTWAGIAYNYPNDWALMYVPVYQVNVVLDALPTVDGDKTTKEHIRGAALFYRAYQYLQGLWIYAKAFDSQTAGTDLGIVLRQNSDQTISSTRSNIQDCYKQIIGDLETAADLLPNYAQSPMRPSKAACFGALSRAYLAMAKYDSAFYYADKVLQLKPDLMDYNDFSASDFAKAYPIERLNKETVFYSEMTTSNPNLHPYFGLVDTTLYKSYGDNDIRKSLFFNPRNAYYSFRGSYTADLILFGGMAVDEMLLIRAETNIRLGRTAKGLEDLNTLLVKRIKKSEFKPYLNLSQVDALKLLKLERRKELLMRGLRWMDIKRYNKHDGDNIRLQRDVAGKRYELEPNSNKYALPLPNDIIQLTGMAQNPL